MNGEVQSNARRRPRRLSSVSLGPMRAVFCLTIISMSATSGNAANPQPSATPAHMIFTSAEGRRASVYTPRPQYPSGRRIGGSGIFRLHVSLKTGLVTSTQIEQSTGYQILDATAIDTLKRWRLKPDVLRAHLNLHDRPETVIVRVPITFSARSHLTNR